MNKPLDYYDWVYQQQRNWDQAYRRIEDEKWAAQRAKDDADLARSQAEAAQRRVALNAYTVEYESLEDQLHESQAQCDELLSICRRWIAVDAGAWAVHRHAGEKADLLRDTRAAIAKATSTD